MWFIFLLGLCIAILMITGTLYLVVYALGEIKMMMQAIKNDEPRSRKHRW